MAQVRYGLGINDPTADHWIYRGVDLFDCYSTKWVSVADTGEGCYSVLPASLSKWRYVPQKPAFWRRWLFSPPPVKRPRARPVHPLVALLAKLPEGERLKHWRRLDALGAFERSYPSFSTGAQVA